MRLRSRTLSIAALVAFGASACANPVESILEEALGQSGVEIEHDGASVSIETEEGDFRIGMGQEIPDDFPADVPVPAGNILTTTVTDEMWVVTYDNYTQAEAEKVLADLEAAGFQNLSKHAGDGMINASYNKNDVFVSVMWSHDEDESILIYGVADEFE